MLVSGRGNTALVSASLRRNQQGGPTKAYRLVSEDVRRGRRAARRVAVPAALLGALVLLSGCARRPPREVVEVNLAMVRVKEGCASVYAPADLDAVQRRVDEMNRLADARRYRMARRESTPILPEIQALGAKAREAKDGAKAEAEAALARAAAALSRAAEASGDDAPAGPEWDDARSKLEDARRKVADPCAYPLARALAEEALATADRAAAREKQRREGEPRDGRGRGAREGATLPQAAPSREALRRAGRVAPRPARSAARASRGATREGGGRTGPGTSESRSPREKAAAGRARSPRRMEPTVTSNRAREAGAIAGRAHCGPSPRRDAAQAGHANHHA